MSPFRHRKRAHDVDVYVGETLPRDGNAVQGGRWLLQDLRPRALLTIPAPCVDVAVHSDPNSSRTKQPPRGSHARVGETMDGVEQLSPMGQWYERPGLLLADVAEDTDPVELHQAKL